MEAIIKTNIKNANVCIDGEYVTRDIFIEGGFVKDIKQIIRQGMFSGVYEFDAENCFVIPTFVDCGCFSLGCRVKGKELGVLSTSEYKQLGFFSFVSSLNILDRKERLINQEKQMDEYISEGMSAIYLSGGMKDRAYHINKDIYSDIKLSKSCVGASVIYDDSYGSVGNNTISKICTQLDAVVYDTGCVGVVYLYIGDLALDFKEIGDYILNKSGREKTVIPWFCNRGDAILDSCIDYLECGGTINLVAGGRDDDMNESFISLRDSLMRIYDRCGSLDRVLISSFSGGYLPGRTDDMGVAGQVSNIYIGVKQAVEMGLPANEALKVLAFNAIKTFDIATKGLEQNAYANFLIVDESLNISRIIDGDSISQPKSFKDLILFI